MEDIEQAPYRRREEADPIVMGVFPHTATFYSPWNTFL
jgi:hypothetical protein